jgi:hypothetical protein
VCVHIESFYSKHTYVDNARSIVDNVDSVAAWFISGHPRLEALSMSAEKAVTTHAELTAAVSAACQAALKAGMSSEDVCAVLTRIGELIEGAEEE